MATIARGRQVYTPAKTFLVGPPGTGSRYTTIAAALVDAIPVTTETDRSIIQISPGIYPEDVYLPDFISLVGICSGVYITGASSGGIILDVGQGLTVESVCVVPQGNNKDAGFVIRDATMIIIDAPSGAINGTLILNGKSLAPGDDETFTFTGEATVNALVATINATATNVFAYNRYGTLAIISLYDITTIYSTGTANAALGLSITADTVQERGNEPTVYVSVVSIIGDGGYSALSGGATITHGCVCEDSGYGSVIINTLSITGSDDAATGIGLLVRRGAVLSNGLVVTGNNNGGTGIYIENDTVTVPSRLLAATAFLEQNTTDLDGDVGAEYLFMVINTDITAGGGGFTATPTLNDGTLKTGTNYYFASQAYTDTIPGLVDLSRKVFIPAMTMYSPAAGGASDVEVGIMTQPVKSFATGADEVVTYLRKHCYTGSTLYKPGSTVRLVCSVPASATVGDVVRLLVDFRPVAISEDLEGASSVQSITDVDISGWVVGERVDVIITIPSGGEANPNDLVEVVITRNGMHMNDTWGDDFYIWGVEHEI